MRLYRARHAVENVFQRLKMYKRVASRFEKTKRMFFTFICVVMAAIYAADNLWQPRCQQALENPEEPISFENQNLVGQIHLEE